VQVGYYVTDPSLPAAAGRPLAVRALNCKALATQAITPCNFKLKLSLSMALKLYRAGIHPSQPAS
jgi:hypothetical protein